MHVFTGVMWVEIGSGMLATVVTMVTILIAVTLVLVVKRKLWPNVKGDLI